jgi:hypothetical protein
MSNSSEAHPQNKLFGRYNEFALLLLAFVLTTVVGGYLANKYQEKARKDAERAARLHQELTRASQVSEEISRALDRRLYRTRVLVWALKDDSPERELQSARDTYHIALAEWNENLNRLYSLVEYSFGNAMRQELEGNITEEFRSIHQDIYSCLQNRKDCKSKIQTIEARIDKFNPEIYEYDYKMLAMIRQERVGSFIDEDRAAKE